MIHPLDRLIAVLASSFSSDKELQAALRPLRGMHEREILILVRDFRRLMNSYGPKAHRYYGLDRLEMEAPSPRFVREVERLLRSELGMPVRIAAEHLLAEMEGAGELVPGSITPPMKESFSRWVQRLMKGSSPSVVLHHAAAIRNRLSNSAKSDWPLKGG